MATLAAFVFGMSTPSIDEIIPSNTTETRTKIQGTKAQNMEETTLTPPSTTDVRWYFRSSLN